MSHVATLPLMETEKGPLGRGPLIVIALTAFVALVDLFASEAVLPSLTRGYGVSPVATGSTPARSRACRL
jgi:hypothetical protein